MVDFESSLCTGTVLVLSDDGSIDNDVLEVGIIRQRFEDLVEHVVLSPPAPQR